jgi:hypothetical protein
MGHDVTWMHLVFALGLSSFGFYYGLTTKLGQRHADRDPAGLIFRLRRFAKIGGWMFAIGGLIGAIRILFMLLDAQR